MSIVGTIAPAFELPCTRCPDTGARSARLADYAGRWLILMFYPRDFSLVCPTELTAIGAHAEELRSRGCEVLGVSTDSLESHERWISTPPSQGGLGEIGFRLVSDESGTMSRAFDVYQEAQHIALRGLFIIDPNGVVQYESVHNLSVGRKSEEIVRTLGALQTGGMCSADWCLDCEPLDATGVLKPGHVLSHYRIEREVGSGTFGSVYRAEDTLLERTVALKVFKPGRWSRQSAAAAEARAAAALDHPNICSIFAIDDSEGVPIIVMEFIEGEPLSAKLEAGPMASSEVADVIRQVASGMTAAHEAGIVHGDLKPANIMLTDEGRAMITDFGLARRDHLVTSGSDTDALGAEHDGDVSGTPHYMSPEQTTGQPPTRESDVFALGQVTYELLSGQRAFDDSNVLRVFEQVRDIQPRRFAESLPDPFDSIVEAALAKDRNERKITMRGIAAHLE